MHVLVTGGAGFIGSHLCERLLMDGHRLTVVDSFDPYYDRAIKERQSAGFRRHARVRFLEQDLAHADLGAVRVPHCCRCCHQRSDRIHF